MVKCFERFVFLDIHKVSSNSGIKKVGMLGVGYYIDKTKTAGLESFYWKDEIISMVTVNKLFCEKGREKGV